MFVDMTDMVLVGLCVGMTDMVLVGLCVDMTGHGVGGPGFVDLTGHGVGGSVLCLLI